MPRVRNPWKFPLQVRALGDAEHGGQVIQPGQIITVSEEVAEEACKTGVLQRTIGNTNKWALDGKLGPKGEREKTEVLA